MRALPSRGWRRYFFGLLSASIIISVVASCNKSVAYAIMDHCEAGYMVGVEYVPVTNKSGYPERLSIRRQRAPLSHVQRLYNALPLNVGIRSLGDYADRQFSSSNFARIDRINNASSWCCREHAMNARQKGRGPSDIDICDVDMVTVGCQYVTAAVGGWQFDQLESCTDIRKRAFQLRERSFCCLCLVVGNSPQAISGDLEGEREIGNREPREGGNETVVLVEKIDGAYELTPERASDDEAAFIGIVGGLVAGFFGYAGTKWLAKIVFGPNKNHESD